MRNDKTNESDNDSQQQNAVKDLKKRDHDPSQMDLDVDSNLIDPIMIQKQNEVDKFKKKYEAQIQRELAEHRKKADENNYDSKKKLLEMKKNTNSTFNTITQEVNVNAAGNKESKTSSKFTVQHTENTKKDEEEFTFSNIENTKEDGEEDHEYKPDYNVEEEHGVSQDSDRPSPK